MKKPIKEMPWEQYASLCLSLGQHVVYQDVPSSKPKSFYNGLELAKVIVIGAYTLEHFHKYGLPVKEMKCLS